MNRSSVLLPVALSGIAIAVACWGGGSMAATSKHQSGKPPAPQPTGPGALQPEPGSTATGDIPDNQVFLVYHNAQAGYSMKYPEGWAQSGSGASVAFRDKNNVVRIVVARGALPTLAVVQRELKALGRARVTSGPKQVTISSARAIKVVYTTQSPPNPVTGKRVTLVVDRYYLGHAGKRATVDLGTPQGVDNVDAYRLMIESFRWK